jgi:predicted MFS family arabinose efflux permease
MVENRWFILAVLFLARTALGFQFQSIASTAPLLAADLHLGYAEVGTLIGLYMLPGVVIAVPGGFFGGRFSDKSVCSLGLLLMIAGGAIIGVSQGYGTAFTGRLISGTGAVLFNLVLIKMVTDWFAGREIVAAMSIILASWPFGIATGLLTQGSLAGAAGWPAVMHTTAGLCAIALALVIALYRAPPAPARARPPLERAAALPRVALPPGRDLLPVIVAGCIWGIFNLGVILFFSFVPSFLVEQGTPPIRAASLASLTLWISMVSVPACGYMVQRAGRPDAAIAVFSCVLAAALALVPILPSAALLLCATVGMGVGPPSGAIMALPARLLSPPHRAAGLGVFFTCYYAINTLGPGIAGLLRDRWGSAGAAVLLGALCFTATPPLLLLFRSAVGRRAAVSLG